MNHTLTVDLKAENFRVLYTDFKNVSNDIVVEANSVQTSYPDGRVVITSEYVTQIIYNDKNETNEYFYYSSNTKSTSWIDEECYYYNSKMLNET